MAVCVLALLLWCCVRRTCSNGRDHRQGFFTPCARDSSNSADNSSSGRKPDRPSHTRATRAKWGWPAGGPAAAPAAALPSTAVPAAGTQRSSKTSPAPTLRPIRTSSPPKTGDLHSIPQNPALGSSEAKESASAANGSGFWWCNGALRPAGHAAAANGKRIDKAGNPAEPKAAVLQKRFRIPAASGGWLPRLTQPRGPDGQEKGKCACQVMMESGDQYPTGWFARVYRGRLEPNGKCRMCQVRQTACNDWLRDVEAARGAGADSPAGVT